MAKKGLAMNLPLKEIVDKTLLDNETVKTIRCAPIVYAMIKDGQKMNGEYDTKIIDELKSRYAGLSFDQLLLLWHENFNSMNIINDKKTIKRLKMENICSFLVKHKVIAIGMLIDEQWAV